MRRSILLFVGLSASLAAQQAPPETAHMDMSRSGMNHGDMAAPKTPNEASSAVVSLPVGKKRIGKTSTAAVAYT